MGIVLVVFGMYVGLMSDITIKRDKCLKEEICTIKPKEVGYEVVKTEKEEIKKDEEITK